MCTERLSALSVVRPCDHAADWEVQLTAAALHQRRILSHVATARKRSRFKIQNTVSTECLLLLHHHKVK